MARSGRTEPGIGANRAGATVAGYVLVAGLAIAGYLALAWAWDRVLGGGIWSLFDAFGATGAGVSRVEVDRDALTTLMIVLVFAACALAISAFLTLVRTRSVDLLPSAGVAGTIVSVIVVVLWFSFSSYLSRTVDDRLLAARHYVRCPAFAHHTGSGRSRTDFDVYVPHSGDCPAATP